LIFIAIYYLISIRVKKLNILQHSKVILFVLIFSIVTGATIIKLNPRLNIERKVGGSVDFTYALNYSKNYTTAKDSINSDIAIGRISTTQKAYKLAWGDGLPAVTLGYGPGALTPSILGFKIRDNVTILEKGYGLTGSTYIFIEYGILGLICWVIVFLTFLYNSWRWFHEEKNQYWKSFAFGTLIFSFSYTLIFCIYNPLPVTGDVIPPVFFYAMAVLYYRYNKIQIETK
jgi:hypothetical protein